jgi:hypothetical protein
MNSNQVNPYRPVEIVSQPLDDNATEVSFRITKSLLRHGEDHFLLHWHPMRLLFCSLAMIFASGAAFVWSSRVGFVTFHVTLIAALSISTVIYLALVHRTKMKIRGRLRDHGLIRDTACSVAAENRQLVLTGSGGVHRWPKDDLQIYRTPRGILICPEPLMFVYVPRRNNSPEEAYAALRESLRSF